MVLNKTRYSIFFVIGVFLILVAAGKSLYNYFYEGKLLNCSKELSVGMVYETNYLYIKTSGLWVYYSYMIDKKRYTGRSNLGLNYKDELKRVLVGKKFPIIYCVDKPRVSSMLIIPENYRNYGYAFPDTLNWVLNYRRLN